MKNEETKKRILLVEDDENFGDVLRSYLEVNDFDVTLAPNGKKGFIEFKKAEYDLCIFDVMMPEQDGFSLAKDVREIDQDTPIIFLTARTMKEDVVEGFRIGGDDYINKPFNSEELVLRVQAILRRTEQAKDPREEVKEFNIGKFHFNYPLRILTFQDGEDKSKDKLSPKEAELLRLFCMHKNEVLERSLALKRIWKEDSYFTARSMDVFVTKLRKYLEKDEMLEIVNIHGNGFRLVDRNEVTE